MVMSLSDILATVDALHALRVTIKHIMKLVAPLHERIGLDVLSMFANWRLLEIA